MGTRAESASCNLISSQHKSGLISPDWVAWCRVQPGASVSRHVGSLSPSSQVWMDSLLLIGPNCPDPMGVREKREAWEGPRLESLLHCVASWTRSAVTVCPQLWRPLRALAGRLRPSGTHGRGATEEGGRNPQALGRAWGKQPARTGLRRAG